MRIIFSESSYRSAKLRTGCHLDSFAEFFAMTAIILKKGIVKK